MISSLIVVFIDLGNLNPFQPEMTVWSKGEIGPVVLVMFYEHFRCLFVCLFVWGLSSNSRIFHSYGYITITGVRLQILINARHLLSSHNYCDTNSVWNLSVFDSRHWCLQFCNLSHFSSLMVAYTAPKCKKNMSTCNILVMLTCDLFMSTCNIIILTCNIF